VFLAARLTGTREEDEMRPAVKGGLLLPILLAVAVSVSCSRDPEVAKREYVASGDRFRQENKIKEAIVQYRNAIKQDPRFGEARFKLAEAYVEDGDWRRASREYIRAADLMPKDVTAQIKAGRVLLFARQFQDAATRAHAALALDRRNVEAQVLLGNALAGLKDVEGAVEEIREAINLDPANALGYVSLGALEHAAGRGREAQAAFEKAIEADSRSVPAHLGLANFHWSNGREEDARRVLQQALDIAPNHILANRMMALIHIASGRQAEAEPYLARLARVSKDPEARLVLADYYIASGRTDQAVPLLEKMASTSARAQADLRLARLDLRGGRRPAARQRVEALLQREPANASAIVLQAEILASEGKRDEAIARLQNAVSANPGLAEAHYALGRLYAVKNDRDQAIRSFNQTLRINPRAVAAQIELSRLELAGGRADNSIQFAEQALKNQPENPGAQLALVRGLIGKRNVRRAETELQTLAKEYPNHATVETQAGILTALKGDYPAAERRLSQALALDQNSLEALNALVSLDLAQKNTASATQRIDARLARTPRDVGVLLLGARTYATAGNAQRAEALLRTVLEVDPANLAAHDQLGRLYLAQQRLDDALAAFDELARRHPHPAQAHTLAGVILQAQRKPREARQRYEQALAVDSRMSVAANNLAWMYVEEGDNLDVALQLAQTATRTQPDNPGMQDTLGWIYYKKGLARLALPPFQRSVSLDPRNPVFHYHLGLAYLKAGDPARARASLQEALTLSPDFTGAADARQILASIRG
jgi:putative PEP-CTERM system TPR-repeat lipoprotein